jgi:hypothetical protein
MERPHACRRMLPSAAAGAATRWRSSRTTPFRCWGSTEPIPRPQREAAKTDEYVSGPLAGTTNLVGGRYAIIDDGLGFSLVPWQPVLEQRIGEHITGVMRGNGIDWDLGRNLGLCL